MTDQYYYLLDGKEHGPFSRAAIDSLRSSPNLSAALYRVGEDTTWRTLDEVGLDAVVVNTAVRFASSSQKTPGPIDLSQTAFRRESKRQNGSSAGWLALLLFVVPAIAVGIWLAKGSQGTGESDVQVPMASITNEDMERNRAADQAALEAECAAGFKDSCPQAASEPTPQRHTASDRLGPCSLLVEEVMGADPQNDCSYIWQHYAMRVTNICHTMKRIVSRDPNDMGHGSRMIREMIQAKYQDAIILRGEFYMKTPQCR